MARISGLRRRVGIAAAISLALTIGALIFALAAAAGARAENRELSQRLVPAAAAAGTLSEEYTAQQTSLRDYTTSARAAALIPYERATAQIPGQQAGLATLAQRYPSLSQQLAAVVAAHRSWLARVAGPQLAATAGGDFARARALQANIPFTRPFVLTLRSRVADLQVQITSLQARATARLAGAQGRLIAALLVMCALVAFIAVGGVALVRRWLLTPVATLRAATDRVAEGHYDTHIPAAGLAELADLGRSTELMRTRLVAALAQREQAEQGFRDLFESSPDATLAVAEDGRIVMANTQTERTFGYRPAEMVGMSVEALVPAAVREIHPAHRARYFADPTPRPMGAGLDLAAMHKDGHEFPVEISLSALPTERGRLVCAAVRDVSERLAAQAERERLHAEAEAARYERRQQQSQRLESLGQLVGGIAHDFNNLLNVIGGYADMVTADISKLAEADQRLAPVLADVEQVRGAALRAARLTRQLLIFARRDVVHPEVLDLGAVADGIEQLLRRTLGEHIELAISASPGLWPVKADPGQLEQVLVNLAINARDAMPGGGKLTIDAGNSEVDATYATNRPGLRPGRYVRLRVSDTGTGMDRETLDRVFEPFFTTKPQGQGTGLGLATVYGIVTQADGHVQIYSEPGLGTTVSVWLPVTSEHATDAGPQGTPAPASGRGETVLLAEDEESLRELARRILIRHGYQVCVATTAPDAIKRASDLGQRFDLLLTDVVMPEMLGNEVADRIHAIRPGLPVLYMSGYAQQVLDTQGALESGVDLLEKPFTEDTLLTRVRQAIDHVRQPGGR